MRLLFACAVSSVSALFAAIAAAAPSPVLAIKLDPRALSVWQDAPDSTLSLWVEFADKGESGPDDLAFRLSQARRALSPRTLARRLRARVHPLVDYRDLPLHPAYLERVRALGVVPYGQSRWFNRVAVRAPLEVFEAVARLDFVQALSLVEHARIVLPPLPTPVGQPVPSGGRWSASASPANYGISWDQLDQVQLPALHDSGYIGTGVLVCLLDDGFNYYRKHDALRDISVPIGHVRDFVEGDLSVEDTVLFNGNGIYCNHGAWTLGCAGGKAPGSYLGAAYGAAFALGRTEYDLSETPVEMTNWAMGVEWADSLGADIISSSLGYSYFDDPYPDYTYADMDGRTTTVTLAAIVAAQKGIFVVTAAGNEGADAWYHIVAPADVSGDSALAVGAVNAMGTIAAFSSRGPSYDGRIKPDVVARGAGAAIPDVSDLPDSYATASGTSFSTPIVAGVAACLLQAHPNWGPAELSEAIRLTATRASVPDNDYGYGLVRALSAAGFPADITPHPAASGRLRLRGPNPLMLGSAQAILTLTLGSSMAQQRSSTLEVLDLAGRRVRVLWNGPLWRGVPYEFAWDGHSDQGDLVPSGVYWVRLDSPAGESSVRIVALR